MSLSDSLISIPNGTQDDIPESSRRSQRQSDGSSNICRAGEEVCIFRVLHSMMIFNRQAYVPSIVSLGPYHHGST
ncbi:hypothetical protein SUGI_1480690, partial [Cryptomeria japonica]